MHTNKARQQIVEIVKQSLQEENLFWRKPWVSQKPYNACSHSPFRGINLLLLYYTSQIRKYSDPRWCTFHQAKKMGWKIKKGTKGVPIEFWSFYDKKAKKNITYSELKKKLKEDPNYQKHNVYIVSKVYYVFNGQEVVGIPPLAKEERRITKECMLAKEVLTAYLQAENIMQEVSLDSAYYNRDKDIVKMPAKETFHSDRDYYAVLAHECAHSTLSENRLPRNKIQALHKEQDYAMEELRAEISSFFLCQDLGLEMNFTQKQNHKAYVRSWLQKIDSNPILLFKIIKEAEKVADYILEKGKYQEHVEKEQIRQLEAIDELQKTWEVEDGIIQS